MTEPAELPQLRAPEQHAEGEFDLPDGVQDVQRWSPTFRNPIMLLC